MNANFVFDKTIQEIKNECRLQSVHRTHIHILYLFFWIEN
jgi:hypothetical protein